MNSKIFDFEFPALFRLADSQHAITTKGQRQKKNQFYSVIELTPSYLVVMPASIMTMGDDVELRNVALQSPLNRTMVKDEDYIEEVVETEHGQVTVAIKGDRSKPTILTYHDLGLNYISNFQALFNFPDMAEVVQNFCVMHVNAPGQEDGAPILSEDFAYPNMDDLAEQVNDVINHFAVVRYIGIGVGMGANILIRHALKYPERVDSLMVINGGCTAPGWIEWGCGTAVV